MGASSNCSRGVSPLQNRPHWCTSPMTDLLGSILCASSPIATSADRTILSIHIIWQVTTCICNSNSGDSFLRTSLVSKMLKRDSIKPSCWGHPTQSMIRKQVTLCLTFACCHCHIVCPPKHLCQHLHHHPASLLISAREHDPMGKSWTL